MKARERLWWNADRSKLLPDGHKDAAILYAAPGDEVPDSAAERYGLMDGFIKGSEAAKAAKAAENKQAAKGENKSGSGNGGNGGKKAGGLTVNKKTKRG